MLHVPYYRYLSACKQITGDTFCYLFTFYILFVWLAHPRLVLGSIQAWIRERRRNVDGDVVAVCCVAAFLLLLLNITFKILLLLNQPSQKHK